MKPAAMNLFARTIVTLRDTMPDEPPTGCSVAFLIKAPNPEGGRMEELVAPEYTRMPLILIREPDGVVAARAFKSANWISVGPILSWPEARFGAVLDAEGSVLGYGPLLVVPGGSYRMDEICFAPTAIELRYY